MDTTNVDAPHGLALLDDPRSNKSTAFTAAEHWSRKRQALAGVKNMRVGLFIPCYVDAFHPEVGIATLELLERLGCDVDYPVDQTCCGQPMTNTGCHKESAATEALFVRNFAPYEYIVAPSGSCVHQVRYSLDAIEQTDEVKRVRARTFELVEFLHDILQADAFPWAEFPHKVALHNNCQTLRGVGIASMSELRQASFSKPVDLLSKVRGIEMVHLTRPDECCGFGGTFSVFEEGVSAKMGHDKVHDQHRAGGVNTLGYLPQHLLVLLDPADIVPNIHHAYRRAEWRRARYAVFQTGPSATADIEGVLIHGAQGVRSLSVLPLARK